MATQNARQPKKSSRPMAFQMPAEPTNIAVGSKQASAPTHPMMPMSTAMVTSIKAAPKGKIPPGLAKWLAAHKKGGK